MLFVIFLLKTLFWKNFFHKMAENGAWIRKKNAGNRKNILFLQNEYLICLKFYMNNLSIYDVFT